MKTEPKIPDIEIRVDDSPINRTAKERTMPFLRTCLKCGANFYSPGEYSTHLKEAHGKNTPSSSISEPRTVRPTMAHTGIDVPAEVLVKPKVKEPVNEVATSRKRQGSAKAETKTEENTEAAETPKKTRTRKKSEE